MHDRHHRVTPGHAHQTPVLHVVPIGSAGVQRRVPVLRQNEALDMPAVHPEEDGIDLSIEHEG